MNPGTQANALSSELYLLRALTHLHPGGDDTGFGVVDKTVQRDPLDGLPVIHASSLKGAFRELFEQHFPPKAFSKNGKTVQQDHPLVEHIFGTGIKRTREKEQKDDARAAGKYRFHEARLLCLPVRSNVRPFFRATCPQIASELLDRAEKLGISLEDKTKQSLEFITKQKLERKKPHIFTADGQVWLEEYEAERGAQNGFSDQWKKVFGENLALFHDDDFKALAQELPVVARNYLENGISENLWYEEIVPRETRFYFLLQTAPCLEEEWCKTFGEILKDTLKPACQVQAGANASVGYGLCEIIPI
jgi:CRISPR-associated protein Cmr4